MTENERDRIEYLLRQMFRTDSFGISAEDEFATHITGYALACFGVERIGAPDEGNPWQATYIAGFVSGWQTAWKSALSQNANLPSEESNRMVKFLMEGIRQGGEQMEQMSRNCGLHRQGTELLRRVMNEES